MLDGNWFARLNKLFLGTRNPSPCLGTRFKSPNSRDWSSFSHRAILYLSLAALHLNISPSMAVISFNVASAYVDMHSQASIVPWTLAHTD
ncbi:hypothetical protein INT44_002658 [Umbelopsis vinacea]|uniref:Uncharacterized protein n=1 Tax=Umbelopsis vinacea TaxID=44442 RepID=A0A8H7UAC6_9FUNG|nr:hypothetical protein INT44_002658 [Umbelopsis vinacea]